MKVLVTGAKGFVGQNLSLRLQENNIEVLSYDLGNTKEELRSQLKDASFIVHLAGSNRPKTSDEFYSVNKGLTEEIIEIIKEEKLTLPLIFASTIQAALDNDYGRSKKEGEDALFTYSKETGNKVYIYRLSNLFGKWSRPNYNSVIATFCHNVAHDIPLIVNDPLAMFNFVYIDDVINEFLDVIQNGKNTTTKYLNVEPIYPITIGELASTITSFKEGRNERILPEVNKDFIKKLYSTYLTYLDSDNFGYKLLTHKDERGSFTEFVKTKDSGQVSINTINPGFTKGNHYHHTKTEKFLVIKGEGTINFRHVITNEVISYSVSDKEFTVLDIPPGYTHNIINTGTEELIFIIWANELFDPSKPDTTFTKV